MIKVNLEKALLRENDNKLSKESQNIDELLEILNKEKTDDLETLNRIFPGKLSMERDLINDKSKLSQISKLKNKYGNKLFTEDQIKKVCVKYGLRFLHTSFYKGNIDPYAIILAKKFESEKEES